MYKLFVGKRIDVLDTLNDLENRLASFTIVSFEVSHVEAYGFEYHILVHITDMGIQYPESDKREIELSEIEIEC